MIIYASLVYHIAGEKHCERAGVPFTNQPQFVQRRQRIPMRTSKPAGFTAAHNNPLPRHFAGTAHKRAVDLKKEEATNGPRYYCELCKFTAKSKSSLVAHRKEPSHQDAVDAAYQEEKRGAEIYCDACRYVTVWKTCFNRHMNSPKHKEAVKASCGSQSSLTNLPTLARSSGLRLYILNSHSSSICL